MDGLRVFFDFTLPLVLLYGSEREQYHTAMKNHAQKCTTNTAATTMDIPDSTESVQITVFYLILAIIRVEFLKL